MPLSLSTSERHWVSNPCLWSPPTQELSHWILQAQTVSILDTCRLVPFVVVFHTFHIHSFIRTVHHSSTVCVRVCVHVCVHV